MSRALPTMLVTKALVNLVENIHESFRCLQAQRYPRITTKLHDDLKIIAVSYMTLVEMDPIKNHLRKIAPSLRYPHFQGSVYYEEFPEWLFLYSNRTHQSSTKVFFEHEAGVRLKATISPNRVL